MLLLAAFTILQLTPASPEVAFREPQLAVSGDRVALVYGAGKTIYAATSADQGRSFSKAVKVAEADILPLSRHRGPRVAITPRAMVVTAVAGHVEAAGEHAHGLPADGDLFAWRSVDGGKTWSKGVRINDAAAAPREGLHTLAADAHGNLFAAWLDNRKEGTRLYGAWSMDAGATWSANAMLYESPEGTICQCCHPSAGFTGDGALDVMWRNALDGARDLYLMRAANGRQFGKPQKLGAGSWKINACPMDGGGLTHAGGRTVTAWRRGEELFLDEPGQPETRLGQGKDVAITASGSHIYAAWIRGTELEIWNSGKTETIAEKAGFPALAALPDGAVLAAWEENGGISVRRVQ